MKISILLPYKENFAHNYAGAVSLFVNDITKESIFRKTTYIDGNTVAKKKLSKNYINLNLTKKIFQSTSKLYVKTFLKYEKNINSEDKIKLSGKIESKYIFGTIIGEDLVPSGIRKLRIVVLPINIQSNKISIISNSSELQQTGDLNATKYFEIIEKALQSIRQ